MVFDCFTFFNELDLLELRLHELDKVVDAFVLVEATHTFQGNKKPLYFYENRERFTQFLPKIIHVAVEENPFPASPWDTEYFQRNAIMRGLTKATDTDMIFISDADEIPCAAAVGRAAQSLKNTVFLQSLFLYYINCRGMRRDWVLDKYFFRMLALIGLPHFKMKSNEIDWWHGTVALPRRMLTTPQAARNARGDYRVFPQVVKPGGWHFSYLGGIEKVRAKLESYAHREFNIAKFRDEAATRAALQKGTFPLDHHLKTELRPLTDSYPAFILENLPRFSHWIFQPDCAANVAMNELT